MIYNNISEIASATHVDETREDMYIHFKTVKDSWKELSYTWFRVSYSYSSPKDLVPLPHVKSTQSARVRDINRVFFILEHTKTEVDIHEANPT